MIDIGPTTNGDRPRRPIHINAATIGAVSSTVGIIIFAAGWITGALMLKQNVSDLQRGILEIQGHLNNLSDRMTRVEDRVEYTAQGIADLKALKAGTNR